MKRWLGRIGLGLLLLFVAAAGAAGYLLWTSLPQLEGEIRVERIDAPVSIVRDAHGIPHIEAESARDAYFAMGFVHAQDRLWQLEMNRRVAAGRVSEVMGARTKGLDRFMRTLGLYEAAEASIEHLPEDVLGHLRAYADGVNAVIRDHATPLPPEFQLLWHTPEPWRVADSLAWSRMMALDLSMNWRQELLRARLALRLDEAQMQDLWPHIPAEALTLTAGLAASLGPALAGLEAALPPPSAEGLGSNIWAVEGARTANGRPLLANDPHLRLQAPSVWYLAHIKAPGLEVMGATLPALSPVVIGRNRHIAWGFTNSGADVQDLFIERLANDGEGYVTPEGPEPFATREEVIEVRGGEAERFTRRATRHGPVISDIRPDAAAVASSGHVLSLAWTSLRPDDRTVAAGFALAEADDREALWQAAGLFDSPTQNLVFADRDGIGFVLLGRVPIRRGGEGAMPVPGWTGEHDWVGFIPRDALPSSVDPPAGHLANANNRVVDEDYPHHLTHDWDPGLRARRLEALLDDDGPFDVERMAAMQADRRSMLARNFLSHLLEADIDDPDLAPVLEALADWDGVMLEEAAEPLIFAAWYYFFVEAVFADELGPDFPAWRGTRSRALGHVLDDARHWCDDVTTAAIEDCAAVAGAALRRAMAFGRDALGEDWRAWRWGEVHAARMAHRPFDAVPVLRRLFTIKKPKGGDSSTLDVAHHADNRSFATIAAASMRMIADMADPSASRIVTATGQSGHPLSPHYRDMAELWAQGRYVPMRMTAPAPPTQHLLLQPR